MNKDGHSLTWDRYGTLDGMLLILLHRAVTFESTIPFFVFLFPLNVTDIYSYLDFLKVTFPSFVSVTEIGKSTEGRPIYAVRLSQKGGRANKKAIFIDSGNLLLYLCFLFFFF